MKQLKKIEYMLRIVDPVIFAEKSTDNILYATKRYFPGSALRGALAARYLELHKQENAHEDQRFHDIFLSGRVRFLPAYPIGSKALQDCEPVVLPLSIMRSKDGKDIIDLSGEVQVQPGYKKLQGFAVKGGAGEIYKTDTDVKIKMHMSRCGDNERITGKSEDGNIYNYECIEPGQYFKGTYIADDDIAEDFAGLLQELALRELLLGRARNAQYGKCSYLPLQETPAGKLAYTGGKLYLHALTPYIPWRSWQRIDEAAAGLLQDIQDKLREQGAEAEISCDGITVFAAAEEIDGYMGVWHAKKPREAAVSAGALIELKITGGVNDAVSALQDVLMQGFGKYTADGYGQFRLWQPLDKVSLEKIPAADDQDELSGAVKRKAAEIVRSTVIREIRQKAAEDAGSGRLSLIDNPSNILKRVEGLMNSSLSKEAIQDKLRNEFKPTAQNNLRKIKFGYIPLFEILTEENGTKQIYADEQWARRIIRDNAKISSLKKELGSGVFDIDEDTRFREYWLWFVRHAVKLANQKGE